MYDWLIKTPSITTRSVALGFENLPRDQANVNAWKPMINQYIEILRKMVWRPVNIDIDF